MAGIDNSILYGINSDLSGQLPVGQSANIFQTNGQLQIGSTALNAGGTHINMGTLTSPDGSITIGYSSPNITLKLPGGPAEDYRNSTYIVGPGGAAAGANYTTIATGYAAAVAAGAPQTVFLQPGTYTENLTLVAGINLCAFDCDAQTEAASTANVIINGTVTASYTGAVAISGICLQTNSNYAVVQSGSNACTLILKDCFLNASNNTAIHITNSNAGSFFYIDTCRANLLTTGIGYFTSTGSGKVYIWGSSFLNDGGSTTVSTVVTGPIDIRNSNIGTGLTTSVPTTQIENSVISGALTCLLTGGVSIANCSFANYVSTGTGSSTLTLCTIGAGSNSGINVGSGCTVTATLCDINSSNTNAITGSGTINYGGITFSGSSSTINTSSQTPIPWPVKQGGTGYTTFTAYSVICAGTTATGAFQNVSGVGTSGQVLTSNGAAALPTWQAVSGGMTLVSSQSASNSAAINFTSIGTYTRYLLVFQGVNGVSNGVNLWLQFSTNGGSTYDSTNNIAGINYTAISSTTWTNINTTSAFTLTGAINNARTGNGHAFIVNPNIAIYPYVDGQSSWLDNTSGNRSISNFGGEYGGTGVNAMRVLMSSGNINAGTFSLYGLS